MHMIRSSWSAPRRPNHQSKVFNLKRFTHVSPNAMRDSRTKSSQNPSKTFPKHSQNPFKTLPKSSQNPSRTPLQNGTREKINFFGFCSIFGRPGASPNRPKIAKNRKKKLKKSKLKNTCFFNSIFFEFSPFWPPKTKAKSRFFCYFFENVDFMKISKNHRKNNGFSWFFRFNRSAKRSGTKPVSRRYATRQQTAANQRKSFFVKRPNGYAYD